MSLVISFYRLRNRGVAELGSSQQTHTLMRTPGAAGSAPAHVAHGGLSREHSDLA